MIKSGNSSNKKQHPKAILAISLALLMVYGYLSGTKPEFGINMLITAAMALLAIGLFIPPLADGIGYIWQKLSDGISWLMTPVLLTVLYILLLTPIALLYRLAGKASDKKLRMSKTAFFTRDHSYIAEDMEKPW